MEPTVPTAPATVVPADYPELGRLAWSRDPTRPISGQDALSLYEANWRHVDTGALQPDEERLIRALAERYGRGHLLATR